MRQAATKLVIKTREHSNLFVKIAITPWILYLISLEAYTYTILGVSNIIKLNWLLKTLSELFEDKGKC